MIWNVSINVLINVSINLINVDSLVLELIKTNKGINIAQIAKAINKSEMTVQRSIKKLTEENLIRRIGSNKKGYWQTAYNE